MSSVWEIPPNYMAEDGLAPKLHGIAAAVHDVMTGACPWVKFRGCRYQKDDFAGRSGQTMYWALMDEATKADLAQERVFDAAVRAAREEQKERLETEGGMNDGR